MISIKLYCIVCDRRDTLENENAPISSRGVFVIALDCEDRVGVYDSILAVRAKVSNTFMECYV